MTGREQEQILLPVLFKLRIRNPGPYFQGSDPQGFIADDLDMTGRRQMEQCNCGLLIADPNQGFVSTIF
jgi:hypothetical protein